MRRKEYYELLAEYRKLIEQKQYNELFVDRTKLDAVKDALCNRLKHQIKLITVDEIQHMRRTGRPLEEDVSAIEMRRLQTMISREEYIEEQDFANTYYQAKVLCGLTLPQFLVVLLVAIVVYLFVGALQ